MKKYKKEGGAGMKKVCVAHIGARDNYQIPLAFYERGALGCFVTDIIKKKKLIEYGAEILTNANIVTDGVSGFFHGINRLIPSWQTLPLSFDALGRRTRRIISQNDYIALSCNYNAYEIFKEGKNRPEHRVIFQFHPHPKTLRNLYKEEIENNKIENNSLNKEFEISFNNRQYTKLCLEVEMANKWIVTSRYTYETLVENKIPKEKIYIVPYGVDAEVYKYREKTKTNKKLEVLFVGSLIQRKGLSYLLEAIIRIGFHRINLTLMGRGGIDKATLEKYPGDYKIIINASLNELINKYQTSDVFLFPSIAEGFGHVVLQAMSCGLPVIGSENTCANGIIENGEEGFVIKPRSTDAIVEKLEWCINNRKRLLEMREKARQTALSYTWPRFREEVVKATYCNI